MDSELRGHNERLLELSQAKELSEGELRKLAPSASHPNEPIWALANGRKEEAVAAVLARLNEEAATGEGGRRQLRALEERVAELIDELELERGLRSKVRLQPPHPEVSQVRRRQAERGRGEAARALSGLVEELEGASGATAATMEASRKRDAELGRLRAQMESATAAQEASIASLRKQHTEAVATLGGQLEELAKAKARSWDQSALS